MNIGVICEGPSDYPAIELFIGSALAAKKVQAKFTPLFPDLDRTRPDGGWANALLWLKSNPPEGRIQRYFDGGLFAGPLSTQPLNAILIHLDSDAIDSESFCSFVKATYNYEWEATTDPDQRAAILRKVIEFAARLDALTAIDVRRHVAAPAVESTETWCVAAFDGQTKEFESLRGSDLINAFMTALEKSEGRQPQAQYANIDKDPRRRRRFCEKHLSGANRIEAGCGQFALILSDLIAVA